MNTRLNTRAFTLIEMMISVALGSLVVYIATVGVRAASQSVSAANRLALENSILRTGVVVALEHTDFWTDYDDPTYDPATTDGKRMRPFNGLAPAPGGNRGLPFTPFLASQASTGYGPRSTQTPVPTLPPTLSETVRRGVDENHSGWDPNAWQAAEMRGWSWANQTERTPRYSGPSKRNVSVVKYKLFGRTEWISAPDPDTSPHHWQQRQLDGLLRSLGSYGMFDYIPANTGLVIYEKSTTAGETGFWKISPEWCSPDGGPDYRLASDGNLSFTLDRLADTWGTVFAMPNRSIPAADRSRLANRRYGTGIAIDASSNQSSVDNIKNLLRDNEQVDRVLSDGDATTAPNKPSHWPSLNVSTLRFIRTGAFINLNRIAWMSPYTGQGLELSFTCFGTTLRGARQQRLRNTPGWQNPFPVSGSPLPHLDSYNP